jgi:hypothetical protein
MKIPVGRTIEGAYGFAFSDFLSIIGTAWFPFVAWILFVGGLAALMIPGMANSMEHGVFDPSKIAGGVGVGALAGLAYLVVISMVNVGIQRKALGLHPGPVFFYFSLGAPVWRMIGAMFLAGLIIAGIFIAAAAVCAIVWAMAGSFLHDAAMWAVRVGVIFVAVCAFLYSALRLTYLLPAVVVAEEHIGIGRAWSLAHGSFWRIFVIILATILPVAIVYGIISNIINGPQTMVVYHPGMTFPQVMQAYQATSHPYTIAGIVLYLAYVIVVNGLHNGAVASAYQSVAAPAATEGMHS